MSNEELTEELEQIMKFGMDEEGLDQLKISLATEDMNLIKTSFLKLLAHSVCITSKMTIAAEHLEHIASGLLDEEEAKASAQLALEKTTMRRWKKTDEQNS